MRLDLLAEVLQKRRILLRDQVNQVLEPALIFLQLLPCDKVSKLYVSFDGLLVWRSEIRKHHVKLFKSTVLHEPKHTLVFVVNGQYKFESRRVFNGLVEEFD